MSLPRQAIVASTRDRHVLEPIFGRSRRAGWPGTSIMPSTVRPSMGNSNVRCFGPEWSGFADSVNHGQSVQQRGGTCLACPPRCALEEKRNISRYHRRLDQRSALHPPQILLCYVASPRPSPPASLFSDMPTSCNVKWPATTSSEIAKRGDMYTKTA